MNRIIALGFFDGVHLGHGGLLRRVRELADKTGAVAAAVTYDTYPGVARGEAAPLLSTTEDREQLMRRLYGIDELIVLPFDQAMQKTPWDVFLRDILLEKLHAVHVVCGHDNRFGHRGAGTPEKLRAFCAAHGVGCDVIPEIDLDGAPVSSTRIRALVQAGRMEQARRLLGHPHCMTATVVPGHQLGRTIGIPTANLEIPAGVAVPAFGVYASRIVIGAQSFAAVTNVGCRPTVDDSGRVTVEPWILDFDDNLYGRRVRIDYYRHLRGEKKFENLDALRAEILRNADETRAYFAREESL